MASIYIREKRGFGSICLMVLINLDVTNYMFFIYVID
jgi:hypothetical protein